MKKSLIALAALAATGAFAQSSVTLYGIVEATTDIGYNKTTSVTTVTSGFNNAATPTGLTLATAVPTINNTTGALTIAAPISTGPITSVVVRKNGWRVQDGNDQGTGTSRIGFRGTEDLGGGLKANFMMEMGIRIDDGCVTTGAGNVCSSGNSGGNLFGRNAWGGVSGGFGEVRVGRQVLGSFGVQGNSWAAGSSNGLYDAGASTAPAMGGVRFSNAIKYISPRISGFGANITLSAPETEADTSSSVSSANAASGGALTVDSRGSRRTGVDLALEYANGPAYVGFGYNKRDGANGTSGSSAAGLGATTPVTSFGALAATVTGYTIGGSYDLGVVKPFLNYSRETQSGGGTVNFATGSTVTSYNIVNRSDSAVKAWSVGLRAPFGPVTVIAGYGYAKTNGTTGTNLSQAGGANNYATATDSKRTAFQLGAQYALSKRTLVEANYGYNKLSQTQNLSASSTLIVAANVATLTRQSVVTNDRVSAINVGLKHSF